MPDRSKTSSRMIGTVLSGRYRLEVFDSQGHLRYAGYLTVLRRPGNLSISTDVEDTRIMTHGDVFLEEFYTKERPNS